MVKQTLQGTIQSNQILIGKINAAHTLQGKIGIPNNVSGYSAYNGEYNIRPKIEKQELQTAQKVMLKNVTVEKIPIYEVSNDKGDTVVIGGEKEYGYQ